MKAFEQGEVYKDFEDFCESVLDTITSMTVDINEYFPDALFFCDSNNEGYVVHAEDIVREEELDDEMIMSYHFPMFIKQNDVKWYLKTTLIQNEKQVEYMLITYGSINGTGAVIAPIIMNEDDEQILGKTVEVDCEGDMFSDFIVPTRRSIVNQG